MKAKRAYRDRDGVAVAVLDALVERGQEGMTVLELRTAVDADIGEIEDALTVLKRDDLISVEESRGSTVIKPDDRVFPEPGEEQDEPSLVDRIRDRLPL